jgi:hypothetical protein
MLLHKNQIHNNAKLFKHTLTDEITAYLPPPLIQKFIVFNSHDEVHTHAHRGILRMPTGMHLGTTLYIEYRGLRHVMPRSLVDGI